LAQVLHRLQTVAPAHHTDGCRCLDSDSPESQEPSPYPASLPRKGKTMHTSTLEPLTILAPTPLSDTNQASDTQCGCGCGCGVSLMQLILPQNARGRTEDPEPVQPKQP
jgi:hypothetical protein